MAIPNELSSEIAAALLTKEARSSRELNELKEVLFTVHSTLQKLTPRQAEPPKSASAARPAQAE